MAAREEFAESSLFFISTEEALSNIVALNVENRAILIKGNRASRLERLSHRLEQHSHTTILEVNLQAMTRNINHFRAKIGSATRLVAMVKASSYGAGEVEVAKMLQKQGISYLAVAFADEGVALREGGITMPIVVLNADDASFDTMIAHSLEPEIYSFRSLASFVQAVERAGEINYPIHLKIDSGMHRLGFMREDIAELNIMLARVAQSVRVASIFTHLCVADDSSQDDFSYQQIDEYDTISTAIMESLPYRPLRHAAASEAMIRFAKARFDMCRLGIGLYGFSATEGEALEPVSTLRTRIVQIRTLHEGNTVGYGRNGKIERESRIATIPVGYADGLNRLLGNGAWEVIVGGKRAKTIGNICMDSCMVDITDIEGVKEGDEVTIFSAERGNTAADMAAVLGTIPYEVLTSVAKRVKRVYINE
jgi:alanine racemase